jgi:hypothetical protein
MGGEGAVDALPPDVKASLGRGGSEGNLAPNLSLESSRAFMAAQPELILTQRSEPSGTVQASPSVIKTGSP